MILRKFGKSLKICARLFVLAIAVLQFNIYANAQETEPLNSITFSISDVCTEEEKLMNCSIEDEMDYPLHNEGFDYGEPITLSEIGGFNFNDVYSCAFNQLYERKTTEINNNKSCMCRVEVTERGCICINVIKPVVANYDMRDVTVKVYGSATNKISTQNTSFYDKAYDNINFYVGVEPGIYYIDIQNSDYRASQYNSIGSSLKFYFTFEENYYHETECNDTIQYANKIINEHRYAGETGAYEDPDEDVFKIYIPAKSQLDLFVSSEIRIYGQVYWYYDDGTHDDITRSSYWSTKDGVDSIGLCNNAKYAQNYWIEVYCPGTYGQVYYDIEFIPVKSEWTIQYKGLEGATYSGLKYRYKKNETVNFNVKPKRPGYDFVGWTDENGRYITQIYKGSSGDRIITAQWKESTYYIVYNSAGNKNVNLYGKLGVTMSDGIEGPTINDSYYNPGYEFTGWGLKKKGGIIKDFAPGNIITAENLKRYFPANKFKSYAAFNLYAQWKPINYSLTVDLDDETALYNIAMLESSRLNVEMGALNLSYYKPQKTGYTFKRWINLNTGLPVSSLRKCTSDITIRPEFIENTYTITFKDGGIKPTAGVLKNMRKIPYTAEIYLADWTYYAPDGYKFCGWKDTKGNIYTTEDSLSMLSADKNGKVEMIALWSR